MGLQTMSHIGRIPDIGGCLFRQFEPRQLFPADTRENQRHRFRRCPAVRRRGLDPARRPSGDEAEATGFYLTGIQRR